MQIKYFLSYLLFDLLNTKLFPVSDIRIFSVSNMHNTNVGDNISSELLSKIIGRRTHKSSYIEVFFFKTFFFIGSIIHYAKKNSVVIGSGFNHESDINLLKYLPQIKFVRGYLTSALLADKFGLDSNSIKVISDPGLLVSDYYSRASSVNNRILLILNHSDRLNDQQKKLCDINFIDVFNMGQSISFSDFFLKMTSYDLIISSALHGVIFSDSYSISCIPVRFQNTFVSEFKFYDYFSSTSRNGYKVYLIDDVLGLSNKDLLENISLPLVPNLKQLKIDLREAISTSVLGQEK
jgi:hypothetical protein